ncbi:phosphotransferase family protein [Actinomadura sp. 1N219]|uniref:phosphotransferase family protein n=1 Tax=Actinomadura sp. 1N219 TaxID=3375152 RepID=UPI0037AC99F9
MSGTWPALQPWVEDVLGARVVEVTRLSAGNSRIVWKAMVQGADGAVRPFAVRCETGSGPLSGTALSLNREQTVYAALAGQGLAVPRLRAVSPAGDALITDWAEGDDRWRPELLAPYLRELAKLHTLNVSELSLPGFATHSRADIDLWWDVHRQKAARPSPFVEFARDVLLECHPGEGPLVLCHGDPGPANFLHDGRHVTALLDWEFAHVGDVHDDLAWIAVRAWMFGVTIPDFADEVRDVYGRRLPQMALDPGRLAYWQAVVLMRNLIIVLSAIEHGRPGRGRFVHLSLRPALQWALLVQVATVAGLPVPELSAAPTVSRPGGDVMKEIALGLTELLPSVQNDADATRRTKLMHRLADQLATTWESGTASAASHSSAPGAGRHEATAGREDRLHALAETAAAELSPFPRAVRMTRTPLPTLR